MPKPISNSGFSLLEMTVVVIIMSILLSAVIPVLSRSYLEKAAQKTSLDILSIQDASRKYFIDHNKWPDASVFPTPIAALQAGGYLPASWNGINPFGSSAAVPSNYAYLLSSNNASLTVSTQVPSDAQPMIQNLLPVTSVSGNTLNSSVSVPGGTSVLPAGVIVPWSGPSAPEGFLWCNGQAISRSTYSELFAVIGTTYGPGDGISTFNLPDLMGRTIVGVDGMGSVGMANRITQWGTAPSTIGAAFGEDAHRQTIAEMVPHSHTKDTWIGGLNGGGGPVWGHDSNNGYGGKQFTDSTGGNNDGSGLGAPSNLVQPSMSLGYIIKY